MKAHARTLGASRYNSIWEFLVQLDTYIWQMDMQPDHGYVFVFTDESYIHDTHSRANSYLKDDGDQRINKGALKGQRLIILHAKVCL